MRPRLLRLGWWFLVSLVATAAFVSAAPFGSVHWTKNPSITVLSEAGDPRIEAVREAIAFWNRTFAELGTPFQLGEVAFVTGSVPDRDIQSLGNQVRYRNPLPTIPASLAGFPGDMLIVLSNAQFISYTARREGRVIVAIKNGSTPPLVLPNVLRNVVAHELGHGVGLGHNRDPKLLMCGRPASCRPDAFESTSHRFFPLSEQERSHLLTLYPQNWTARARD